VNQNRLKIVRKDAERGSMKGGGGGWCENTTIALRSELKRKGAREAICAGGIMSSQEIGEDLKQENPRNLIRKSRPELNEGAKINRRGV